MEHKISELFLSPKCFIVQRQKPPRSRVLSAPLSHELLCMRYNLSVNVRSVRHWRTRHIRWRRRWRNDKDENEYCRIGMWSIPRLHSMAFFTWLRDATANFIKFICAELFICSSKWKRSAPKYFSKNKKKATEISLFLLWTVKLENFRHLHEHSFPSLSLHLSQSVALEWELSAFTDHFTHRHETFGAFARKRISHFAL